MCQIKKTIDFKEDGDMESLNSCPPIFTLNVHLHIEQFTLRKH